MFSRHVEMIHVDEVEESMHVGMIHVDEVEEARRVEMRKAY